MVKYKVEVKEFLIDIYRVEVEAEDECEAIRKATKRIWNQDPERIDNETTFKVEKIEPT